MNRSFSRRAAILLLALAAVGVSIWLYPSRKSWAVSRRLSDAMSNAQSVTLVEFEGRNHEVGEVLIFQRVTASHQQQEALRKVIGGWNAPIPDNALACYEPHHSIEIRRMDGSILQFEVCFSCGNFGFDSRVSPMPEVWTQPLRSIFADAGMPPRSRSEYAAMVKNHPDYERLRQKQKDIQAKDALKAAGGNAPESLKYSKEMLKYMKSREESK